MIVSSHLFEAFLECPTKCWLRSRAEPTAGNAYAEWVQTQNRAYCELELKRLVAMHPNNDHSVTLPVPKNLKNATWRLITDIRLSANDLESRLKVLERVPAEGGAGLSHLTQQL
jgi:hypothetical protein